MKRPRAVVAAGAMVKPSCKGSTVEIVHEEWQPVVGFEGQFEVSSLGRVKALAHSVRHWCGRDIAKPERIVNQSRHSGGYAVVSLRDGKKHFVHRLVMQAFVGEPPAGMNDVNHIDGVKQNNCRENLEYCTRLHNVRHALATGLQDNSGENNGGVKYTEHQIRLAHGLVTSGRSHKEAAKIAGVDRGTVEAVCAGKRWQLLKLPKIRRKALT